MLRGMATSLRAAISDDYDSIFMMGFDIWGSGRSTADYLSSCHNSPKYKRGHWWVLVDEDNGPLSSLIIYDLSPQTVGIGSLATLVKLRKRGYASKLLTSIITHLETMNQVSAFYLFADIEPGFYERFGFISLPKAHQQHQNSVCMIRSKEPQDIWSALEFHAPKYF